MTLTYFLLRNVEIFLAESFHRILNMFAGYYDTPLKILDSTDSNEVCTTEFHFILYKEVHKNILS